MGKNKASSDSAASKTKNSLRSFSPPNGRSRQTPAKAQTVKYGAWYKARRGCHAARRRTQEIPANRKPVPAKAFVSFFRGKNDAIAAIQCAMHAQKKMLLKTAGSMIRQKKPCLSGNRQGWMRPTSEDHGNNESASRLRPEDEWNSNSHGRSPGLWIILLAAPSHLLKQTVACAAFVLTYSGGSAADLHRFPFLPLRAP